MWNGIDSLIWKQAVHRYIEVVKLHVRDSSRRNVKIDKLETEKCSVLRLSI